MQASAKTARANEAILHPHQRDIGARRLFRQIGGYARRPYRQRSGLLDRAAIKGVRKWRFKPAKLAGIDVRSRVRVPVRFELER